MTEAWIPPVSHQPIGPWAVVRRFGSLETVGSGGTPTEESPAPPDKGDQALSNLRKVEVFPSGARLVFEQGMVFASRAEFRRGDIKRFVEGLRGLGAQVVDMGTARN